MCAVHGAELAAEMVWSEKNTLLCKHEEVLKSQNQKPDLSLKLKMTFPVYENAILNYY